MRRALARGTVSFMKRFSIPRVLAVCSIAMAGCSGPTTVDSGIDVVADAVSVDTPTVDAPAVDAQEAGGPICRYDPTRPPNDPCESANLGGKICVFNRDQDGGIECFLV
jgi:hypothetical protein